MSGTSGSNNVHLGYYDGRLGNQQFIQKSSKQSLRVAAALQPQYDVRTRQWIQPPDKADVVASPYDFNVSDLPK